MSLASLDRSFYDHLVRLLIAGGVSVVLGAGLAWARPAWRAFGLMNAAWGAVDLAIAGAALRRPHVEDRASFAAFLHFNLGLNFGYIAIGITMVLLAGERQAVKGSGAAVALQGALLLVLDGYLAHAIAR